MAAHRFRGRVGVPKSLGRGCLELAKVDVRKSHPEIATTFQRGRPEVALLQSGCPEFVLPNRADVAVGSMD
jgi:hypothetical protein